MRIFSLILLSLIIIPILAIANDTEVMGPVLVCPTCHTDMWIAKTPASMTIVDVEGDYFYTCAMCWSRYANGRWYTRVEWMEEVDKKLKSLNDKEDY